MASNSYPYFQWHHCFFIFHITCFFLLFCLQNGFAANILEGFAREEFKQVELPVNSKIHLSFGKCLTGVGFIYEGTLNPIGPEIVQNARAKPTKRYQVSLNATGLLKQIEACKNKKYQGKCWKEGMRVVFFQMHNASTGNLSMHMQDNLLSFGLQPTRNKMELDYSFYLFNQYYQHDGMHLADASQYIPYMSMDAFYPGEWKTKLWFFKNWGCTASMSIFEPPLPREECNTTVVDVRPAIWAEWKLDFWGKREELMEEYAVRVGCTEGPCLAASIPIFMNALAQWKENATDLAEWSKGPINLAKWSMSPVDVEAGNRPHWHEDYPSWAYEIGDNSFQYIQVPWGGKISMLEHSCKGKGKFLTAAKQATSQIDEDLPVKYDWQKDFEPLKSCNLKPAKEIVWIRSKLEHWGKWSTVPKPNHFVVNVTVGRNGTGPAWNKSMIEGHKYLTLLTVPTRQPANRETVGTTDVNPWCLFVAPPDEAYGPLSEKSLELFLHIKKYPWIQGVWNNPNATFLLTMATFECANTTLLMPCFESYINLEGSDEKPANNLVYRFIYQGMEYEMPEYYSLWKKFLYKIIEENQRW